jgi:long-subunit fatty acid transport protein
MLRAGLEFRFTSQFSGRLGYALAQNPYRSSIQSMGKTVVTSGTIPHYTLSNDATYFTGGIGFRFTPQFYGDIALVYRTQEDQLHYFPPVKDLEYSYLTFTNKALKGLLTLGYKF